MALESDQNRPFFATPHDLRERLSRGLFVDNDHLREMMRLSAELSKDTLYPTVFRTIGGVFSRLLIDWEESPLTVQRASRIEGMLREPLIGLVDGVINRAESDKILKLLDDLTFEADLLNDPSLNES